MNKKVLMVAFHYLPSSSAGVQRTLKTAEYLPLYDWEPFVLTVKASAYPPQEQNTSNAPPSLSGNIYRTLALDVFQHFSYKGKHFGWMTTIDRWSTWIPGAILKGNKIIKEQKPDLIWSTSPIPSAHIIAKHLSKKFSLPWVADFRDPFSYHYSHTNWLKKKILSSIDKTTIQECNAAIFTTNKAKDIYKDTFSSVSDEKFFIIENGFDEQNWKQLDIHKPKSASPFSTNKFSLFYSGFLYQNGRDPKPLFLALMKLQKEGVIDSSNFELIFQGAGDGLEFSNKLTQLNIKKLVKFLDPVPYLDSLMFMKQADVLVLIQDAIFNLQIPGKLYEYIRSGRPILTMTPANSATAGSAKKCISSKIVESQEDVAETLLQWIKDKPATLNSSGLQEFSRLAKTSAIADVFKYALDHSHTQNP